MARPRNKTVQIKAKRVAQECNKVVMYARFSTSKQEKEGFSIPAQQKLMREYAVQNGITIATEHVDVEKAKRAGRTGFEEMLRYIRPHPSVRTILVEKTARLYRNLKDWVTVDGLDIETPLTTFATWSNVQEILDGRSISTSTAIGFNSLTPD